MRTINFKYISSILIAISYSILAGAQSISIDATDYKQTIDMMGGDMERSSNAIQSAQNKEEIVDWAFKDIAFNVCRVQFDKNQEMVEGAKNWAFYSKQITSMKMVKASSPDIKFFATLRTDYDGYGDKNNLPDWFCNYSTKAIDSNKFGVFLADYVEYMSNQGVPISYLSIVKEWANYVPAAVAKEVIVKMNSELEAREIDKPLIIDQGFWSLSKGISELDAIAELGTKDLYHAFCSHNYKHEDAIKWDAFINAATNMEKAAYNDETSGGYGGPTYGVEPEISIPLDAYAEKCEIYKSGLKGEVFFEIWSRGIDKETRAIYYPWGGTAARMRGYYIMKMFANNILNSKYITSSISSMPNVYTMSFRLENKLMIWLINKSTTSYNSVPITVSNDKIDGLVNQTTWTSSTPVTGSVEALRSATDKFQTDIPSQSLSCYLFDVEIATSVIDVEKNNLVLYPTLVKNGRLKINRSYQPTLIQVVDLNGIVAKNFSINKNEINVSGLKSGMYLVRLSMTDKQLTQKIIIE